MTNLDDNLEFVGIDHIGTLVQRLENNLERLSVRATGPLQKGTKALDLWGQERYDKDDR
jgi:hypothetical protein